jgi:hypothetical protein
MALSRLNIGRRDEREPSRLSSESQARVRAERVREKAKRATDRTRGGFLMVGAFLAAIFAFIGGVVPYVFGGVLEFGSWLLMGAATGLAAIAVWFRRASDEPAEKVVWLVLAAVAVAAIVFWVGGM